MGDLMGDNVQSVRATSRDNQSQLSEPLGTQLDRQLGRRGFLEAGALGSVAALAFGKNAQAEEAPSRGVASGEDADAVRVAVIGTGGRGCDLVRSLATIDRCRIVAVCDDYPPHLKRGQEFAGPQAKTYADYHKMLSDIKPDAVIVAVPLSLHFAVSRDVLESGADVFCEKTMCYSLDEAKQLEEIVNRTGRVFQVGLQLRFNPVYRQAKAMVEAGVLGRISAIKCQWHRHNNWRRPVPVGRDDARWAELEHRLNWRLYNATSRGLLTELGSHQLDICNWVLGKPPVRAYASGGIDYWRDGREVDDNVFCTYEYELNPPPGEETRVLSPGEPPINDSKPYTVRATFSSLCNNAYEGASELIMGTRASLLLTARQGLLYWEPVAQDVGWAKAKGAREANASIITAGKTLKLNNSPWAHRGTPVEIDNESNDETRDELMGFLDHVIAKDPATEVDVRQGRINTATVLIAHESLVSGKPVPFPQLDS